MLAINCLPIIIIKNDAFRNPVPPKYLEVPDLRNAWCFSFSHFTRLFHQQKSGLALRFEIRGTFEHSKTFQFSVFAPYIYVPIWFHSKAINALRLVRELIFYLDI